MPPMPHASHHTLLTTHWQRRRAHLGEVMEVAHGVEGVALNEVTVLRPRGCKQPLPLRRTSGIAPTNAPHSAQEEKSRMPFFAVQWTAVQLVSLVEPFWPLDCEV